MKPSQGLIQVSTHDHGRTPGSAPREDEAG